ncbi:MAG: CHAT domain-containing protein [Bacteroidota bacterium]
MPLIKPPTPVAFLAFANERSHDGFLRQLTRELKAIMRTLEPAVQKDRVDLKILPAATQDEIAEVFQDEWYEKRVEIFHYGGHADEDEIWLEDEDGGNQSFFSLGLARFLGSQQGLRLVFLNACATKEHAQLLMDAGIPAVIATSRKIGDNRAQRFARYFYQGLAAGASIEEAFGEAEGLILGEEGPDIFEKSSTRSLYWDDVDADAKFDFPWRLFIKKGAELVINEWRLFYAEKPKEVPDQVVAEAFIGQTLNNTYELVELLGQGSLGAVFKARHTSLNEFRAIKITHRVIEGYPQLKNIILAGVKGLGAIQHPNVVRFYDAGEVNLFGEKRLFMVMELVTGTRLDKIDFTTILYKKSQLKSFLDLTLELCGGFAAAHNTKYEDANGVAREGIVHGNVKPRKILFTDEGIPKIIDFLFTDLTRSPDIKLDIPASVREKKRSERPEDYFPPEVISGRSGVNKLTDIYGMGAVFFEVVSGQKLGDYRFEEADELHRVVKRTVSFFPSRLSEVMFKATRPSPQDRYLTVDEMQTDILEVSSFSQKIWYNFIRKIWYRIRRK